MKVVVAHDDRYASLRALVEARVMWPTVGAAGPVSASLRVDLSPSAPVHKGIQDA
ncbi:hypothetical protein GCM10009304_10370 [Pseudomonas matsuisoli]|uniref:Uncharacterized protein n=1 Tax=Pseudomonas matsuisoli TaxID=1515666 RepID=A0A917UUF6_9PSED|nr:hypothetical protein GCM10009304_10370 [Pseudomonas matsuisoli]